MHPGSTRASRFVKRRQAANFLSGISFAEVIGRPINYHVTLNFDHTDAQAERVSELFERIRDNHFTRWLRYLANREQRTDCAPPTYAWVIENRAGKTHVHWPIHLPDGLRSAFEIKLGEWLFRVAGDYLETAINITPTYRPSGLAAYCMKGADPNYTRGRQIKHTPQGTVIGKRCGVSKSLGPAARARQLRWADADLPQSCEERAGQL